MLLIAADCGGGGISRFTFPPFICAQQPTAELRLSPSPLSSPSACGRATSYTKTFRRKSGGASGGFGGRTRQIWWARAPRQQHMLWEDSGRRRRTKGAVSLWVPAALAISRRPPSLWHCRAALVTPQETPRRLPGRCQGPQKGREGGGDGRRVAAPSEAWRRGHVTSSGLLVIPDKVVTTLRAALVLPPQR